MNAFIVENPLLEYLKLKYPDKCLCVIQLEFVADDVEIQEQMYVCGDFGVEWEEVMEADGLFVVEGSEDEMTRVCDSVPNDNYAYVIVNGEVTRKHGLETL